MENSQTTDEMQLRRIIDNRIEAVRQKNIDGALASYATDVLSFDVVDPLQFNGFDAVRKRLELWFSSFGEGPIGFDISDLRITVNSGLAYCHNLNHVHAVTKDGKTLDMWWRETTCYQKTNDNWLIVHAHNSVPFNPTTGKASLDLKPEDIQARN